MPLNWIPITTANLHRLTETFPPHLRWTWTQHKTHKTCLLTPRRQLWKFHLSHGPLLARINEE